jgi:RimJ/RimL family protein N-acetyltransferase
VRDEPERQADGEAVAPGARPGRDAEGVDLRRAVPGDVDFLAALLTHGEVEPYLSARRPKDRASLLEEIERSRREPNDFGLFVIEVEGRRAGTMEFEVVNRRSRIAQAGGLAVHPDFRGRGLADGAARLFQRLLLFDLGMHRVQLEIYGFNARAMRHAEHVGFAREGVRRRAYWRHGRWVDGILYGLVREDLVDSPRLNLLLEYVARHNAGVRDGEWGLLAELFAEDAELVLEGVARRFRGREAVDAAFRERPPTDELRVLDVSEDGEDASARYAWAAAPEAPAGRLLLTSAADSIARLVVTTAGE